jgi:hypothetical protein
MVDAISRACADAHTHVRAQPGVDLGKVMSKDDDVPSVRREDIVRSVKNFFLSLSLSLGSVMPDLTYLWWRQFSLAEAQKMTSMYAKMEYGVKRLLWLGG